MESSARECHPSQGTMFLFPPPLWSSLLVPCVPPPLPRAGRLSDGSRDVCSVSHPALARHAGRTRAPQGGLREVPLVHCRCSPPVSSFPPSAVTASSSPSSTQSHCPYAGLTALRARAPRRYHVMKLNPSACLCDHHLCCLVREVCASCKGRLSHPPSSFYPPSLTSTAAFSRERFLVFLFFFQHSLRVA